MEREAIRKAVRDRYGRIAVDNTNSCCGSASSCCSSSTITQLSKNIGYTEAELKEIPEGANLGLGCGNPVALASLREGEIVLDLGAGAGFDCFLAANRVGKSGRIIGVDMTPEMVALARENASKNEFTNVEFRLGEIENLPVADNSIDVIISNCVINLSLDKARVFGEAFRVLKPKGRLMISDIVLLKSLPDIIKSSIEAYVGCVAGALIKEEYLAIMEAAGFSDIKIVDETPFSIDFVANDPAAATIIKQSEVSTKDIVDAATSVLSVKIHGTKIH